MGVLISRADAARGVADVDSTNVHRLRKFNYLVTILIETFFDEDNVQRGVHGAWAGDKIVCLEERDILELAHHIFRKHEEARHDALTREWVETQLSRDFDGLFEELPDCPGVRTLRRVLRQRDEPQE